MTTTTQLAIDGGPSAVTDPLPGTLHGVLDIGEPEIEAVTAVLRRKTIFRFLNDRQTSESCRLEDRYREWTGRRHALAVGGGGTCALICGLVGMGIGTGDEVIIPGYTYIATAAACLSVGAIPILAEIDQSLTLDPASVEKAITPHTRAIIPVHMRGCPADMNAINDIAARHDLKVLEDVAQANGGTYHGTPLGAVGHAGAFSLQHYKMITAGEGGVLITDDEDIFKRAAIKHDSAMQFWADDQTWPSFAGENYRMCELRAALGLAQFDRLPGILERTRANWHMLTERTAHLEKLSPRTCHDPSGDCGITWAVFAADSPSARRFSEALAAEGVPNATIFNKRIPDRHIYNAWDYVMEKRTSDPTGWPWTQARRPIEYHPQMLPQTLNTLGRCIAIGLNQHWREGHIQQVAEAIIKVHDGLAARDEL
ncbi:MAG: DegT/DnrJ/EryC1/StrS family aminotransferase [Phycisphaeraceae bacterium]|nr:DegT/DnrJ/EryC1/StrS family aminotransferase [Phycisphaeraceae bacterium]